MLKKLFSYLLGIYSFFFMMVLNLFLLNLLMILFAKISVNVYICFSVFNLSFAVFIVVFRKNKMSYFVFCINMIFLFVSFLGCLVCIVSSNFLFVAIGFFVSSLSGVLCLVKSIKSLSISSYMLLFFTFVCDSFMMVFVFFFISTEYNFLNSSSDCVFCIKDWLNSNNSMFMLLFLSFAYKSAWFMSGFWVYFAMDAGYYISCFLHSSGVIFLGLCLWMKIIGFLSIKFMNYVVLFCLFGCFINVIFFLFSNKFKKSLGNLSCLSYNIMFVLILVNSKLFAYYFIFHSLIKCMSFFFIFIVSKFSNKFFLFSFLKRIYLLSYLFFLLGVEVFLFFNMGGIIIYYFYMVMFMIFLEFFCYVKFLFDFNYVLLGLSGFLSKKMFNVFSNKDTIMCMLYMFNFFIMVMLIGVSVNMYVFLLYVLFYNLILILVINSSIVDLMMKFFNKYFVIVSNYFGYEFINDVKSILFFIVNFISVKFNSMFSSKSDLFFLLILFFILLLLL